MNSDIDMEHLQRPRPPPPAEATWAEHREKIQRLYIAEGHSRRVIMAIMQREHDFIARYSYH